MNSPALLAKRAVFVIFVVHGTLLGAWAPHIALAKERFNVGTGVFGLALLSLPVGAVVAMPIAGGLINKFGSSTMTYVTGILFCVMLLAPPHAPTMMLFVLAGIGLGIAIGSMDVAMNAHGLAAERVLKKPIMSVLHGGFSLGAIGGTFAGAFLLTRFGTSWQTVLTSGVCLSALLLSCRFLLPADADKGLSGSHFAMPTATTLGLGALCFLALMIEGSILDWGAIFMREQFVVDVATAALAFGCYQGGMAFSRFTGDVLRLKFGATRLVTVSALITAVSTAVALFVPSVPMSFVAFILAGVGIGNVAPVLFAGGGRLEPDAPGRGIAAVTTMGYTGFLAGPPLIGFAAQVTSLQWGLALTVIAALIIALFARMVAAADTY
jgi:MFS family permease